MAAVVAAPAAGSDAKAVATVDGSGSHKLKSAWTFSFLKKAALSEGAYEKMIKPVATFDTVEGFWSYYSHLLRPSDVREGSLTYHLFRAGVAPVWEDATNKRGGKWTLRLKKGVASRVWEDVLLAVIGGRFASSATAADPDGDELCGVVLALKFNEDVLSVWTKTAANKLAVARIRDVLKSVLGLAAGQSAALSYTAHDDAAKAAAR